MFNGLTGFLIGGLAGALIALFNAPRSGEETRAKLRDKSIELKDKAVDRIQDTRAQATQLVDNVKDDLQMRADKLKHIGREVMEEEKRILEENAPKAKNVVNTPIQT
jgi:gas vesicle protein